jgi:ankyrin repeat protein
LKAGADPKRVDNDGDDALMNAAGYGHLDAMEYLLAAGFPVTNRNLEGNTVLMSGAWSKNWQIVSALLQAGADKNTFDNEDMTALMQAADGGDSEAAVIQVLLNAGADPNLKDKKGRTALQIAEAHNDHGFDEVIKLLKPVTSAK